MELKRIIARDSRAANDKAIQLYGPDVLVISSQRVDNQTELIVAIDTDEAAPSSTPANAPVVAESPVTPDAPVPSKAQQRFQAFADVFKVSVEQGDSAEFDDEGDAQPAAPQPGPQVQTSAASAEAMAEIDEWIPAALRLAQPEARRSAPVAEVPHAEAAVTAAAPVVVAATPPAVRDTATVFDAVDLQRSRDTVELLRQEIAALRQEFNLNRQVAMWQSGQGLSPELTQWFAQMQEIGVPASLRTLMADAVSDCVTVSEAWPRIHQTLQSAIQRKNCSWPQQGVHALVGPSGAGKSLMAARMAMAAAQQTPVESMAIISLSDTKAGAWSQLQVLAAQSGVACYRAGDTAALEVLLQELSHLSVIWIDTPGTDFLAHARTLHAVSTSVSLHAVLPADATVTNVRKIFDAPELQWSSVMLTKLDEAAHPWHVLKALCDRPWPVSAMASSHQARSELLAFEPMRVVDLAMQGLQPQGLEMPPAEPVKKTRRRTAAAVKPAQVAQAPKAVKVAKTKAAHG